MIFIFVTLVVTPLICLCCYKTKKQAVIEIKADSTIAGEQVLDCEEKQEATPSDLSQVGLKEEQAEAEVEDEEAAAVVPNESVKEATPEM